MLIIFNLFSALAQPLPPTEISHPGSLHYNYSVKEQTISCLGRSVTVFLPQAPNRKDPYPVVVYGHGQSIGLEHYRETFIHLARKGVASIFPLYDTNTWDVEWTRMGIDYIQLTKCTLEFFEDQLDREKVIFSGHSKGAFVASVAAGVNESQGLSVTPKVVILFEAGGYLKRHIKNMSKETALHVIFAENDHVAPKKFSQQIYELSPSDRKQFILLKNYDNLETSHFWPLTRKFLTFGGPVNAFHHYSSWKWLVAAAWDLESDMPFTNSYLYGAEVSDKGVDTIRDSVMRNW